MCVHGIITGTSPSAESTLLFLIFLCHSRRYFCSSRECPYFSFLFTNTISIHRAFPLHQRVSLSLFLLVLYFQLPQVLPITNLNFDKLVVVFAHTHPKEWPFLVYSKFHCFVLSLFSCFHNFWTFIHVLYTSPTTSNVSLTYVATNFVMNFLNLFPYMVLHTY